MNRNERRARIKRAVEYLQNYMATYDKQEGYLDYSDGTLIDDVLYGLGVALEPEEHRFYSGYDVFKKKLLSHLGGRNGTE